MFTRLSISRANKRMLIWFLIGVFILLLPWFVMAQPQPVEKVSFHFSKSSEEAISYAQAVRVGNMRLC